MNTYTLITGGSTGIGLELAHLFARDNNNLILVARNEDKLRDVKSELESLYSVEVKVLALDLSKEENVYKVYKYVEENNFIVDNLVNNAGLGSFGPFTKVPIEKDIELLQVNINALTLLTKLFLPQIRLLQSGGILNVASTAAFQAGPYMSVYYASKAYVLSLTEALHEEYKDQMVKITALCPGPVDTEFQSKSNIEKAEFAKKYIMDPAEVALAGYKGFKANKVIVIPGVKNKALIQLLRVSPRSLARRIILSTNDKK